MCGTRKIHRNAVLSLSLDQFFVETLPRAREVGQSYVTSVFTTLIALLASIRVVLKHCPRLVLCNGPGTCIPICFVAGFVQLFMRKRTALVFVESICRTQTLSLSGKILYYCHLARVIVQWPELLKVYPRAEYLGLLS
ncbi:unnamed protein product [Dibothriocephalus latus]|uniref:UDP-N-acetylglucosamine transferase subunit ALG14 n=1 Tax=Dibothriocephalus latus TaxID=60516 RepID=A0A3P6V429_DIBLA|nr:unnamed protein product [Dibothriocephalus latus]